MLLAGCQGPDVGQPCTLHTASVAESIPADFLEAGNTACDSLVCIQSPAAFLTGTHVGPGPYCSKPCVSNDDCYQGDTGLVCRPVTVSTDFLATLPAAVQTQYLRMLNCPAGVDLQTCAQNSQYCAAPVR